MLLEYESDHKTGMNITEVRSAWTREGIVEAVRVVLMHPSTLFDDMIKHLPSIRNWVYDPSVNGGRMFGFITEEDGNTAVSNRIFEIVV